MTGNHDISIEIHFSKLPLMEEALAMYEKGMSTGVNAYNREMLEGEIQFDHHLSSYENEMMFDPQTSGGLLVAIPHSQLNNALSDLQNSGVSNAKHIGYVRDYDQFSIRILK